MSKTTKVVNEEIGLRIETVCLLETDYTLSIKQRTMLKDRCVGTATVYLTKENLRDMKRFEEYVL